ncbi:MAG: biotin carboxylase N-terminal domain-containing protein [Myxococcota bacterium]
MTRAPKVLVANRGEIAVRVIRTLRELGLASVAVYTEVDEGAPHVTLADEAFPLGEPRGYLSVEKLVAGCTQTGATHVHPGYGFLSQSAVFVRACDDAGVTFIGPSAQAMELLGDKSASRALAERVGVPVIPGAERCADAAEAKAVAATLGYPVLLKAAAGGGGKGMRRVNGEDEIAEAFAAAQREASNAFSDDRMLLERFIFPARHVEVQILADGKRAVAIGERECSLQRRYQKVLEEGPASTISEKTRQGLFDSAVALCQAAGYASAGTVEFLVGPDGQHYFLEVNTRLQVEHPVTECLTGLDIVRCQIELADGGSLPERVAPRGHAIEARLNAEDAFSGYLPQTGEILMLEWPHLPGVRVDSGLTSGQSVSPHYDSLIAKVIAHGSSRESARVRLIEALQEVVVLGVTTNQRFLIDLLESDVFRSAETYTTTLESMSFDAPEIPEELRALAQGELGSSVSIPQVGDSDVHSPWSRLTDFRVGSMR